MAEKIAQITGFRGQICWDNANPDGQPRRCLDVNKAQKLFGFKAKTDFDTGLKKLLNGTNRSVKQTANHDDCVIRKRG